MQSQELPLCGLGLSR